MTPTTAFPFSPLRTLFFNSGHQGRIKIRVQVIVNYRIFLWAPQGNHDPGSALSLKELYRTGSENENVPEASGLPIEDECEVRI